MLHRPGPADFETQRKARKQYIAEYIDKLGSRTHELQTRPQKKATFSRYFSTTDVWITSSRQFIVSSKSDSWPTQGSWLECSPTSPRS